MWPNTKSSSHPTVSIVTPTYNRRSYLCNLIECILQQTYPKDRMEWVIFDDGTDRIEDMLETVKKHGIAVQYLQANEKQNIGVKRNALHTAARGEIIVCMDDDDYYPPDRVTYAVHTLRSNKGIELCGASTIHMYFTDDQSIWRSGPYTKWGPFHATFGTMAFTKRYAIAHRCNETVLHAEEIEFTNQYRSPLAQLDPMKTMLVICHSSNTYDKRQLRHPDNIHMIKTSLKLRNFIQSAKLREKYIVYSKGNDV